MIQLTILPEILINNIVYIGTGALAGYMYHCLRIKREDSIKYVRIDRIAKRKGEVAHCLNKKGVKKEASTIINEFVNEMRIQNFDIDSLYENLTPHPIEERKVKEIGSLDPFRYKLIVDSDNLRPTLLRALLDAASTRSFDSYLASGFERRIYKTIHGKHDETAHVGFGLNEGYKDVLLRRYFGIPYRYPELANIVTLFEFQIGRQKMERAFFKGDLQAITDIPEVRNWMSDLDTLYRPLYHEGLVQRSKSERLYRQTLLYFARLTIAQADDKFYKARRLPYRRSTEMHIEATAMMQELNRILSECRKEVILEPGLKPEDYDSLKKYAEKKLRYSPVALDPEKR